MKEKGCCCKVVPYEGAGHGFFNYSRNRDVFHETVRAADAFLVEHGLLPAKPHAETTEESHE